MPLIEKQLMCQLDTKDTSIFYSTSPDQKVMELLKHKYVGKCFKECYILDVLHIVERSPFLSDHERCGGTCVFDVAFVVKALIYEKDEVIPQAEVLEISEDGVIALATSESMIGIMGSNLQTLKIGDKLPVRVHGVRYKPMHDKISVQGVPFVPLADDFKFTLTLSAQDVDRAKALIPKVEGPSEKVAKALYPYAKTVDVNEKTAMLDNLTPGTWQISIPPWLTVPFSCVVKPSEEKQKDGKALTVLRGFVLHWTKKLKLAAQLAELYKFDKSESHIWAIYESGRLPLPS